MGLFLSSTWALSQLFSSLLLLAVMLVFAHAGEAADGLAKGQPANNPPAKTSRPTASLTTKGKVPTLGQHRNNPSVLLRKLDDQLLLEVRQAPLAEVLKQIADKTGALIHYSVLPEEPVTATCAGITVKAVMECLLGSRVDRIYRQTTPTKTSQSSSLRREAHSQATEIWLMGSRFGTVPSTMQCVLDGKPTTQSKTAYDESQQNPNMALLRMAQVTSDPRFAELRKQAISMLAAQGKTGDTAMNDEVTDALQQALKDQDPEIRAQAVFGMMNQDSTNTQVLHDALQDNNPDVRLMAVDSAKADDPGGQAVLQEALNDSDEAIKAAASHKLRIEYVEPGQ